MGVFLMAIPSLYFIWQDMSDRANGERDRADRERAIKHLIEPRAYEIWQECGGNAEDNWNRAKFEIMSELGWL